MGIRHLIDRRVADRESYARHLRTEHSLPADAVAAIDNSGVEERADYYDQSGALRDMVPNHLFQLISMIGMEPPNSFDANDL